MKKIIQNFKTGETSLVELPAPACSEYSVLIETKATLISIGTERMLIEFGKGNLIEKARQQPDKVKQVLQKVKTDGVAATVTSVQSKLDQPIALGYCNAGIVREVGAAVTDFAVGDRVVSNGGHAEFVSVATNLCAKIPDNVSDEEACFTVAAAIGLQGVRLAEPTLGEQFVVIGLGLIGLLTTQLLLANGCEVLGVDFDQSKCDIAQRFGAKTVCAADGSNPVSAAKQFSDHKGVDGVIITASTKSSEPLSHAANMCRQRGRVVLIGVIGNEWSRADFYEKEISLQVSCSYGPGRYDLAYEELGQDYPRGFVRWTEQRNFEAILQLMSSQSIDTAALISHRYDFEQALEAYDQISGPEALGVVLQYTANTNEPINRVLDIAAGRPTASVGAASVGVIGAGNFSSQVLLPALASTKARLHTLASEEGLSSTHHGKKHGFEYTTTDKNALISNPGINTVFITTRHGNHAELVSSALAAGKNVFVEKPLAINQQQLDQVRAALDASNNENGAPQLMIGFNRRFSSLIKDIKQALNSVQNPIAMVMTVNAGYIPGNHWTQSKDEGGGRLIGEACHFIDLLRFLAGHAITTSSAQLMQSECSDTATINLTFANGTIGTVHYFSNGHKDISKERLEVYADGKVIQMDNFRSLKATGWKNLKSRKLSKQDKGHAEEIRQFIAGLVNGQPAPIPLDELIEVSQHSLNISPWS